MTRFLLIFSLGLLTRSALAEEVDRAPSGTIVTVRPEEGEKVAILDEGNQPVSLPLDLPKPMWLVHPDSWRQAVALGEKYNAQMTLPTELKALNTQLELDLALEKKLRSELRIDLENSIATHRAEVRALRRSRLHWALGTGVLGLVAGGAGVAIVVL